MGKYGATHGLNAITDYRSNCIANQQLAQQLGVRSGQELRHTLMNNATNVMAQQQRQNTKNHNNACVACPLCNNGHGSQQPGILQRIGQMLFG